MLTLFRRFAKSWVAAIIIGLIALSFVVVGTQTDVLNFSGTAVVKAGGRTITPTEFKRLFDNAREQQGREGAPPLTQDAAVEAGLDRELLTDLALTESFAELLKRMGVTPADKLIADQIRETTVFFNPVSGAFDEAAYQRQLAQNGLTPAQFEGFLRDDLAQRHYVSGAIAGLRAPRIYGAVAAVYEGETRNLTYFVVDPKISGTPNAPTDAELTAFIKENREQLTRPETRTLSVARFSAAQLAPTVTVDPAEVQRRFDFSKDSLSEPERRTFVQITAPDQAAATRVAQRLRAGEAAAVVASSIRVEPVRYEAQPRTAVVDRAAADAAFGLPAGGISDPFRSTLGFAVVRVETIAPGRVATLEAARPAIEQQLRTDLAATRVLELTEKFEAATADGRTLAEAARAAGVTVEPLPPLTRQGALPTGQPTGAPEPLLQAAWDLPAAGESELIQTGENEWYAVRVERITPASVPPLAEIRAPLTQVWTLRKTVERARARADQLAGQARGANARQLEQLAGTVNATVATALGVERDSGGQTLSRDLVAKAFNAKKGEIIVGEHTQLGFVVARVDATGTPSPQQAALTTESQRPAVTVDILRGIGDMARAASRTRLNAKTWPDRARRALGLEPEAAAPAGAGTASGSASSAAR